MLNFTLLLKILFNFVSSDSLLASDNSENGTIICFSGIIILNIFNALLDMKGKSK